MKAASLPPPCWDQLSSRQSHPPPPGASLSLFGKAQNFKVSTLTHALSPTLPPNAPASHLDKQTGESSWEAGCIHCPHERLLGSQPGTVQLLCGFDGKTLSRHRRPLALLESIRCPFPSKDPSLSFLFPLGHGRGEIQGPESASGLHSNLIRHRREASRCPSAIRLLPSRKPEHRC